MTVVGSGGVVIQTIDYKTRFKKDLSKLDNVLRDTAIAKIEDLLKSPRPPGLAFEKLKGCRNPDIYTVHVTGNCKISMEIVGNQAILRRIANHDEIDRAP